MLDPNASGQFYVYVPVEAQEVSMFSNSVETGSGGGTNVQGGSYTVRWDNSGIISKGWIVTPNGPRPSGKGSYEMMLDGGKETINFEPIVNNISPGPDYSQKVSEALLSHFNEVIGDDYVAKAIYVEYAELILKCATKM